MNSSSLEKIESAVATLNYEQKGQEHPPSHVGTGFFIHKEEPNIYYFLITNHNLSPYIPSNMLGDGIKKRRWIFSNNQEFDENELKDMIPDLVIYTVKLHKPGVKLETIPIVPSFIESILYPKEFLDKNDASIDENDFLIFKINLNTNPILDGKQEKWRQYYEDLLRNKSLHIYPQEELNKYINCFISHKKKLTFIGFPVSSIDYDCDYDHFSVKQKFEYFTVFGTPVDFDGRLITLNQDSLFNKQGYKVTKELNGLSGAPVFTICKIKNENLHETKEVPFLVGMAIRETQIIYINYINNMISNKNLFELKNPNYLKFNA